MNDRVWLGQLETLLYSQRPHTHKLTQASNSVVSVSGSWFRLFWKIVCCKLFLRVASPWWADCKPCQPGLCASAHCLYKAFPRISWSCLSASERDQGPGMRLSLDQGRPNLYPWGHHVKKTKQSDYLMNTYPMWSIVSRIYMPPHIYIYSHTLNTMYVCHICVYVTYTCVKNIYDINITSNCGE